MKASLLVIGLAVAGFMNHPMTARAWPRTAWLWSPAVFQDYSQLYGYIARSRGLGDAADADLTRRLATHSTVERLRNLEDCSAAPIIVVRADLLDRDGTSRLRSADGSFPLYVLRETPQGLLLLGRMSGMRYRAKFLSRGLEFTVEQHRPGNKDVQARFRIEGDTLIDLSAARERFQDAIA
ncbi:MAG: hypothetical protein ACREVV_20720 [Steroidobacteraceae bacterium]